MTKPSKEETTRRIASLMNEVPRRGLERYPSIEKEMDALPEELKSTALLHLTASEKIDKIILFPPQIQRGWNYVPKQALIFTETGLIHCMASIWPEVEPRITFVKGCDLLYIEITLILLYGSLVIVGNHKDSQTRMEVEFNTVAWEQLSAPLYRFFHREEKNADPAYLAASTEIHLPIKFSNGISIYGLLKNERLEGCVFQPEQWQPWLLLFRKQTIASTMVLMTSNYLVIMREELKVHQGWILTYIPQKNIDEISQRPNGPSQQVNIHLKHEGITSSYQVVLSNEAATQWREAWSRSVGKWQVMLDEEAQVSNS